MSTNLTKLIHSLFDQLSESLERAQWQPAADVYRLAGNWLVKFDLAGVRPEDIKIRVSGRRLQVEGHRRDWLVGEVPQGSAYSMEISYSQFARTLELPCDLERAQITTDYRDGMLLVRIQCEAM
jgi:HSP20 family protein